MTDFRRQVGDVRTSTVDPRLYREFDQSQAFRSVNQGLGNLQNLMNNGMAAERFRAQQARQAEADRLAALGDAAADTAAQDMMLATTDLLDGLVQHQLSFAEPDADLSDLSGDERRRRLLALAQGQGRSSSYVRTMALVNLQARIESGDPERASEYMKEYQALTGKTYLQEISELADEAQAFELSEAKRVQTELEAERTRLNLPVDLPLNQVAEYSNQFREAERQLQLATLEDDTLTTNENIRATRASRRALQAAPFATQIMQQSMRGNLFNADGSLIDFAKVDPNERTAMLLDIDTTYNQSMASLSERLGVSIQDLETQNPLLRTQLDFYKKVVSGEVQGEMAATIAKQYENVALGDLWSIDGAAPRLVIAELLGSIQNPELQVELRNHLSNASNDPIKGLVDLMTNEYLNGAPIVSPTPGPDAAPDPIGEAAAADRTTRAENLKLGDVKDAFTGIGVALGKEQFDAATPENRMLLRTLHQVGSSLAERPNDIPKAYMQTFVEFTATEQGAQALRNAAEAGGYDDDLFNNFFRGYDNYVERTMNAIARDIHGDVESPGMFNFLDFQNATNDITYQVMPDGRIAFMPREGRENRETPFLYGSDNLTERVKMLNRKYSDALSAEVRSYAHLVNNNTDYGQAAIDLFSRGSFLNNNTQNLLDDIRSRYPDLADATEEELRNALGG
jgi:hypothetical protein